MRRTVKDCLSLLAALAVLAPAAWAGGQGYPGGRPGMGGQQGMGQPGDDIPSSPPVEKPDAAAKKAFNAGVKSLNKAREAEEAAAKASNPDKRTDELGKANDYYGKALDQFTEALSNNGDMVEAWNYAAYIHLRLGAYSESIDDYNHTLKLQPELLDAIEHRAEAYVAVDRLEDAQAAYMYLFNHTRPLADQLMTVMQKWVESHRAAANGMRPADIDAFDKWVQERSAIAKQTASNP